MKSKFINIAEQLMADIKDEKYTDRLPSEQDLATHFSTTTITVRKALELLLQNDVIEKIPCVGTFVKSRQEKKVRIFWPNATFLPDEDKLIRETVQNHFSELDIEFSAVRPNEKNDYDLIRIIGTTDISYSEYTMPFPLEVIERYQGPEYFSAPFNVHRINNFYYALPILFSPSVLCINQPLFEDFGKSIEPYGLDWNVMLELSAYARKNSYYLWNATTALSILRCLIFSHCPNGALWEVDINELRRVLLHLMPLWQQELVSDNESDQENTLMWCTCRQNILNETNNKRLSLAAFPANAPNNILHNRVTGEFILISNHSSVSNDALNVAEYFLAPDIQQIIGHYRTGLPILKSAALDSLDSRYSRDDLYFNEAKRILTNNAIEQEFLLRLKSFSENLINGNLAYDEFMERLDYEVKMACDKEAERDSLRSDIFYEPVELQS